MTRRLPTPGNLLSREYFLESLRASRLLTPEQWAGVVEQAGECPPDGESLAARLVADGLLTDFQARCLLNGKSIGLVLGQYRLLAPLGTGGMGEVYLAEHVLLRRRVALKILADQFVPDESAVARFRWEVQVAAQLSHPNIVAVHDAGECEDQHFLVMEYVDGIDLGRLVRRSGPLPIPLACECIRQAAMGLQHAYHAGFVHCDIKPSNFILTRNLDPERGSDWMPASPYLTPHSEFQMVKIVDLGLARRWGRAGGNGTAPPPEGTDDLLAGSADYLAPERASDPGRVDIRSDLYGLGCTFYYLLTGRAPFEGGAWPEKLLRHQLDQATPLRQLRPDVPEEIESVVRRLMSKEPEERHAVPAEVAVVLHEWLARERIASGSPVPQPNPRPAAAKTRAVLSIPTIPNLVTPPPEAACARPRTAQGAPADSPRGRWTMLAGSAVLLGLAIAAIFHYLPRRDAAESRPMVEPAPRRDSRVTLASQPGQAFPTLLDAVHAARDGDTVELHGPGPFVTPPLVVRGKSLTFRSGDSPQPRVQLAEQAVSWQPLLTVDRAVRLEGIELAGTPLTKSRNGNELEHLLYAEGAAVHLRNCRLRTNRRGGVLVARGSPSVSLEGCEITAPAPAVVLEVGVTPASLTLARCQVTNSEDSAALTIWASESTPANSVRLHLSDNTIQSGRIVAVSGAHRQVQFDAQGNHFVFREALLSYAGGVEEGWRQTTTWHGQGNRYRGSLEWLLLDGRPLGIRGLEYWRAFWKESDADSVELLGPIAGRDRAGR